MDVHKSNFELSQITVKYFFLKRDFLFYVSSIVKITTTTKKTLRFCLHYLIIHGALLESHNPYYNHVQGG